MKEAAFNPKLVPVMDRIGSDWINQVIGHVISFSVTLSERVLVSLEFVRTSRLSFFLLQLRILVVRQSTRASKPLVFVL
jgi:hypothetical protein